MKNKNSISNDTLKKNTKYNKLNIVETNKLSDKQMFVCVCVYHFHR